MEPLDEWSIDANEAIEISLVVAGDESPKDLVTFHPRYTYHTFGDNEAIYGYKGLKVKLRFAAHDLKPLLDISWDKKVPSVGSSSEKKVEADDVWELMRCNLPQDCETDPKAFESRIQNFDYRSFTPPGKLYNTYTLDGKTYEIWCAPLINAACKSIINNIQILILYFIEGGSLIQVDDETWTNRRWHVYFLYEKTKEYHYTLVGYSTVYRYWFNPTPRALPTPETTPTKPKFSPDLIDSQKNPLEADELPVRARISQFLILPPYQSLGHGGLLYDNIINHLLSIPTVHEITVEDPSDAFETLRDLRDLTRLRKNKTFTTPIKLTLSNIKSFPIESLRTKNKMPLRQFRKVMEMELLSKVDKKDPKQEKDYRLFVKERIYRQNRDLLAQLDRLDRIDKLDETFHHLSDDYLRLLRKLQSGPPEGRDKEGDDEDEEDEDHVMKDVGSEDRPRKRVKT